MTRRELDALELGQHPAACLLCAQAVTPSVIGTARWRHGWVHGDCVLVTWLTGRWPVSQRTWQP